MFLKPLQTTIPLQMVGLSGEEISITLTEWQCPWKMLVISVRRSMVTWYLSAVKMKITSYGNR